MKEGKQLRSMAMYAVDVGLGRNSERDNEQGLERETARRDDRRVGVPRQKQAKLMQ